MFPSGVKLLIILALSFLFIIIPVKSQVPIFLRSCNGLPGGIPGDVYCTAACGAGVSSATCSQPDGLCLCNYPCGTAPPNPLFNPTICPAPANLPQDDPAVPAACMDACPQLCTTGAVGSSVCGSTAAVAQDTYLSICTCSCASTPCVTTTTARSIVLLPNPLTPIKLKKKIKWGLVAATVFKFSVLFLKLIALTLLKILLCALFFGMADDPMEVMENIGWGMLS